MISAVKKRKYSVKRIEVGQKEDVVTASVFDTLLLLPGERVWKILRAACYGETNPLPEEAGELQFDDRDFWPHWDSEGTTNTRFVEPDVFIPFEKLDLIIEAKRNGNNLQTLEQWKNELESYCKTDAVKDKVFLMAIDGLSDREPESVSLDEEKREIPVVKTDWARLLEVLQREKNKGGNGTESRIIGMAIEWLEHFGYGGMTWLDELIKEGENKASIAESLSIENFEADLNCLRDFCIPPELVIGDGGKEYTGMWFCDILDIAPSIGNYKNDIKFLEVFGGQNG